MFPRLVCFAAMIACCSALSADDKEAAVDISGTNADETLVKLAPANSLITTEAEWKKLAEAWGIKDAPKVDFSKQLLIVATTRGSRLNLKPSLDAKGDLKVAAMATRDLRDGFRFAIKSVSREGIKTVEGKELPK